MNTNNESSNNSAGATADDTARPEASAPLASEPRAPEAAPSPAPETAASSGNGPTAADAAAERDALRDQLLRTAADFDNFRKRTRREMEDARNRGKDEAIKEILPVFDNLERAVAAAEGAQAISSVIEGVKMVLKLFEDTAERMGLQRVKAVGERFDPAIHEAIQQQDSETQAPGTILTEVVPGYTFGPRLLRAAMVVVARKPNKPAADTGANGEAKGGGTDA